MKTTFKIIALFILISLVGLAKFSVAQSTSRVSDICATDDFYYILRSDKGLILRVSNMNEGTGILKLVMNPSNRGADHYFANADFFYLIKGNSYTRVSSLTEDGGTTYALHPDCQGGSHYFANQDYYFFIRGNTAYRCTSLNSAAGLTSFKLDPECQGAAYYFAKSDSNKYCFVRTSDPWVYFRTGNLNTFSDADKYKLDQKVLEFMTGA